MGEQATQAHHLPSVVGEREFRGDITDLEHGGYLTSRQGRRDALV
jgi:hypothetical protein